MVIEVVDTATAAEFWEKLSPEKLLFPTSTFSDARHEHSYPPSAQRIGSAADGRQASTRRTQIAPPTGVSTTCIPSSSWRLGLVPTDHCWPPEGSRRGNRLVPVPGIVYTVALSMPA